MPKLRGRNSSSKSAASMLDFPVGYPAAIPAVAVMTLAGRQAGEQILLPAENKPASTPRLLLRDIAGAPTWPAPTTVTGAGNNDAAACRSQQTRLQPSRRSTDDGGAPIAETPDAGVGGQLICTTWEYVMESVARPAGATTKTPSLPGERPGQRPRAATIARNCRLSLLRQRPARATPKSARPAWHTRVLPGSRLVRIRKGGPTLRCGTPPVREFSVRPPRRASLRHARESNNVNHCL